MTAHLTMYFSGTEKLKHIDPQQIDLGLLLEEIRQLRIQLVRTIENNNSLRQKLEEQLARSVTPTHTLNIHHHGTSPTHTSHASHTSHDSK